MLKWDEDLISSTVEERCGKFSPNGKTIHDYEERFALEDEGCLRPNDSKFKWKMCGEELNYMIKEVWDEKAAVL